MRREMKAEEESVENKKKVEEKENVSESNEGTNDGNR
jgi:hypothetical protein